MCESYGLVFLKFHREFHIMKVIFFCIRFPLASETFVLHQVLSFIEMGHDVEVVSIYKGDMTKVHDDFIRFNIKERTRYIFDEDADGSRISLFFKRFISVISNLNKRSVRASFRFLKSFDDLKRILIPSIAAKLNKSIASDVIISHFGTCGVLADQLREVGILKGSLATVFHGFELSRKDILFEYRNKYKQLFERGDVFLPISEMWRDKLLELFCDSNKIHVIRMGIDVDKITYSPKDEMQTPLKIISVCRLTEKKGIEYVIRACSLLKAKGMQFTYTIVGFGELQKYLDELIISLGLQDNVKIIGFRPQSEIHSLLKSSDIFVLPSITASNGDMEGIPVSLMEAMASGLPLISTFHSGIPELISNEKTGWLCNEKDYHAIARVLYDISKNVYDIRKITDCARVKIENDFNQKVEIYKMANILERIF